MIVDFATIAQYLLDSGESNRGVDFFNCGLRAIVQNPEGKLTRAFLHNLIRIWHSKYEHNAQLDPFKVCYFD